MRNDPDTDHYIPNYDRDGYVPGPRYGNKPEVLSNSPFVGQNNPGGGFPMMGKILKRIMIDYKTKFAFFIEMMNAQMMNQGWNGNPGRYIILCIFTQLVCVLV